MRLDNYSCVRLLTNKYASEGAYEGDRGAIIEVYNDDAYEVEFSDNDGITVAQIVAHTDEISLYEPQTTTQ